MTKMRWPILSWSRMSLALLAILKSNVALNITILRIHWHHVIFSQIISKRFPINNIFPMDQIRHKH